MEKGNGLGENKVPAWNTSSVGDYKRGLQEPKTSNIPNEKRPGPGQKAS